ncbi:MAG: type II secretion system protein [Sulfuricella sp.]|nr:type II secretion system protein [Sulfuricella sp.]
MCAAPARAKAPGPTGFTLLELVVVVSIVAILAGVFLKRAQFYQEQAEKVAMEQTVGIIRSALHLQMAALITKNRMDRIPHLAEQNPMEWLAEKPKGYVGEFFDPKIGEIPRGSWYYDLRDGCLVYLVNSGSHFVPREPGRKWIRYRAAVEYESARGGEKEFSGVIFKEVEPFQWF